MSNPLSFMSASFVARQLGYRMTEGWGQGDRATQDYFRPLATFEERFSAILTEVQDAGFDAIDIWLGHLHPSWASPEHVSAARRQLAARGLRVASLANGFGNNLAEFERSCKLAVAMGTTLLGGSTSVLTSDRASLVAMLRQHGVKLAYENHPEKTPADVLAKLGQGDEDVIGVALDTGWFATQGFDPANAIDMLGPRLMHIHLKDVRAAGKHDNCGIGTGIVPVARCLEALKRARYQGGISMENHTEDRDPMPEIRAALAYVRGLMDART